MENRDRLIGTSRLLVRLAIVTNRVFLLAVIFALIMSWLFADPLTSFLGQSNPGVDAQAELVGLRIELLLGAAMAIATDRLLGALSRLIASAGAGDPFDPANAKRLRTIGWALLVLQLLDVPGAVLIRFFPSLGSAAPQGDISIGGWVAVLMVFVLSRVFAAGSVMRDELDGTV